MTNLSARIRTDPARAAAKAAIVLVVLLGGELYGLALIYTAPDLGTLLTGIGWVAYVGPVWFAIGAVVLLAYYLVQGENQDE